MFQGEETTGPPAWEKGMATKDVNYINKKILLSEKIFRTLRDKIVILEYPPGMSLVEKDLCKDFNVSRTPLREAMRRLENMNLVDVMPRFGTLVSPIDINEIRCAFEVKTKLEGLAGSIAAKQITSDKLKEMRALIEEADALGDEIGQLRFMELDTRFHKIIYQSTQNTILHEFLETLQYRCARLWISSLHEFSAINEVIGQIKEIYDALKNRHSEKAASCLENHVQYFVRLIKNRLL